MWTARTPQIHTDSTQSIWIQVEYMGGCKVLSML